MLLANSVISVPGCDHSQQAGVHNIIFKSFQISKAIKHQFNGIYWNGCFEIRSLYVLLQVLFLKL